MPQGSILGSLLHIIYVNDIFKVYNDAKCVLYADNTVILVSGPDLDVLWYNAIYIFICFSTDFCSNKLALNDKKSSFVIFSYHPVPHQMYDTLNFDDHIVLRSVSVIYLDIIFDEQLNFKLHTNAARDKIAKGNGMISMHSYFMPINCLISVYN